MPTKAESLARLRGRLTRARVPPFVHFRVGAWRARPRALLQQIAAELADDYVAVRSSATSEDGAGSSRAGHFRSYLDVPNEPAALTAAIEGVLASFEGDPGDQVLVQAMVRDVAASGVVLTHHLDSGAPYAVVEYDDVSARTDRVTAGAGTHKTVLVHHQAPRRACRPDWMRRLLDATRELQRLTRRRVLEIEFAVTRAGSIRILQVRRVTPRRRWSVADGRRLAGALDAAAALVAERGRRRPGVAGGTTILGQMPDWNPAELLGRQPRPLATSLFRRLIGDAVWRQARAAMGYRRLPGESLLVVLAGRPYVDVRTSFNSFLPAGLPARVEDALVDAWLARLRARPELHDKIEFAVAETILDLAFARAHRERYAGVLAANDLATYVDGLRSLTDACLDVGASGSLARALGAIEESHSTSERAPVAREAATSPRARALAACNRSAAGNGAAVDAALHEALALLEACRRCDGPAFAVVARHAFIAEAMLRSAVQRGALAPERLTAFKRSLATVGSEIARDFARVARDAMTRDAFLARWGHLRPGSFDVTSARYDQRASLFGEASGRHGNGAAATAPEATLDTTISPAAFTLMAAEARALDRLLQESHLVCTAGALLHHAAIAIRGRERAKLLFTRRLSDALERLAAWGALRGLSRDDLSFLEVADLRRAATRSGAADAAGLPARVAARRVEADTVRDLHLGPLILDADDLSVVREHGVAPNFITARTVEAPAVRLAGATSLDVDVSGRVVCIESADPGFDWIFARGLAALVTQFGGANSHMAIRCVEMGIPAAIGVGEALFTRLTSGTPVELRCGERVVRPASIGAWSLA